MTSINSRDLNCRETRYYEILYSIYHIKIIWEVDFDLNVDEFLTFVPFILVMGLWNAKKFLVGGIIGIFRKKMKKMIKNI